VVVYFFNSRWFQSFPNLESKPLFWFFYKTGVKECPVTVFQKIPEWKNLCFWFFENFQNQRTFGSGFFSSLQRIDSFHEKLSILRFFENSAYVSNLVL
jgi:hypothetical protein